MHALLMVVLASIPWSSPSITGVVPSIGRPQGGELVRITGSQLDAPVRVFFRVGDGDVESVVVSTTDNSVDVISPPIALPVGQQFAVADVTVMGRAGTPNETRTTATQAYRYQNALLEPRISTLTPFSGTFHGGTRVTIFGEGFQPPVQVLVGDSEARVLDVDYDRIVIETPAVDGPGPARIRILNINSQTSTEVANAFRYRENMELHRISPSHGPCAGGTRLRIEGTGFSAPVHVTVADVPATPVSVTDTEVIVQTAPLPGACREVRGDVEVVNIASGELTRGGTFTYGAESARRRSARH